MITLAGPPSPTSTADAQRVEHQRMRREVLYGLHRGRVEGRVREAVGLTRATAWKLVDMTSNPAWYTCEQLSALYRETPEVTPPEGGEDVAASVAEAGLWQLMQRVQRDTIGLRDTFVRVGIDPETDEPYFHLVPPDLVEATGNPGSPSQPAAMREWMPDPDNEGSWVRLITDPRNRVCRAVEADGVTDATQRVLGQESMSGDKYPFLIAGKPVLPYVAYHAAETSYIMDPYTGQEVFEGTLQLGVYYSFFGHILRNAAWGQRWVLGARPAGGDVDAEGRRKEIIADPATLLILEMLEDAAQGSQAQVGQFSSPVDPERILAAVERCEQRVVDMALSTVGVSRRDSDVRSAMSLAVSREAQREAQRAYEPMFRRSDIRLLRLTSGLMGGPTDGWRLQYRSLPRDPAELAAELDRMTKLIEEGLLDKVTAYQQLHPGLTAPEAEAALRRINEINVRIDGPPASVTPKPEPPTPL